MAISPGKSALFIRKQRQKQTNDHKRTTTNNQSTKPTHLHNILKYSKISYGGLYDLKQSINTESGIQYSYFDECFGVNIDFKRNSYSEGELKPQDIMTVMFSFKNLGSYKSTNLIDSGNDKQEIEWESISVDNDLFY